MHILLLITQYELAGAQKATLSLADYFAAQGHQVTVAFFYDKQGDLPKLQAEKPYPIINLHAKENDRTFLSNAWRAGRGIRRLFRLMRQQKPDVVQTMTHYSNAIGIPLARLARVPVRISSQRNSLIGFPAWFLRWDAVVVNAPMTDEMIAVSDRVARFCIDVEGMRPDKITTIPNGIDVTPFQRPNLPSEAEHLRTELSLQNKFVVLTIGRLHFQKGHQYLMDAAEKLTSHYPQMHFVWVGDGEMREELQAEIKARRLSDTISLLGVRRDIPQLLTMSDLFVLPSLFEGMPNVVLEAFAAQRPVIATDVEGTNELITHAKTGWLVPSKSTTALQDSIAHLYNQPQIRTELARAGFERVRQKYTIETMCDRFLSRYQKRLSQFRLDAQK